MASKDFDPDLVERLVENVEKLNDILGNSTLLMSDEEKARREELKKKKDSAEKEQKIIKEVMDAQEKEIQKLEKSSNARDKEIAASMRAQQRQEVQRKAEEALNNKRLTQYQKELKELQRREEQISVMTRSQREEIAKKNAGLAKAQKIEDMKDKIAEMNANKGDTAIKAFMAAGKFINGTFLDSTRGQSKYGEAMDSLGDKVIGISMLFGPWGKAIGLATGGLMKLAAMGLKHNEEMNKAYENLSEFGQVDVKGIPQLFENLQNAGFVMKEMGTFQGVMKDASKDLAYLGATAAEGQQSMTQLYGKTLNTQAEKTLKNLGYTNEQALKTYINYSTNLARLGLMQGKTQAQVQKESLEYATTLDELTKLTGVQRDELQERQRRAEQDVKYRIAMARATPEMQKQIRSLAMATADGGEEFAAGVRELIANGGNAVTETGIKLSLATNGAANKIIKRFNRGEIDYAEASRELAVAMDKREKEMRNATVISGEVASQFGISAETMDFNNKWMNKTEEAARRIREQQVEQASGDLDAQRRAETRRQISERNGEQAKDKLAQLVGKGISPAMEGLEIVVNALGKAMAGAVKLMTFGKVDLTGAYASSEDKIKDKEKELNETKLKLARAQRSRNDVEAKKLQAQYDLIQKQISELKGEEPAAAGGGGGGGGGAGAVVGDAKTKQILDYIGKVESGGNYNKLVGGKTADLTNMSIAQVMQYQKGMTKANGFESTAVGKYQVIAGTLKGILKDAGVSESDKFDAATQDKIAIALMKRRGYDQYQRGTMSKGQFANNLAQEWASMPSSSGRSAYHGVGSNRSLVARADFENVLSLAKGGLASGPTTGYPAILHGTEIVIPMENTKDLSQVKHTPLIAPANALSSGKVNLPTSLDKITSEDGDPFNSVAKSLKTEFESLTTYLRTMSQPSATPQQMDTKAIADTIGNKLDLVIDQLRRAANTQEELLQHSRN